MTRDDHDQVDDGSFYVYPTRDTTYMLAAMRSTRNDTCKIRIDVINNDVIAFKTRHGGIPLGAVPYTGFEAGPVLTALFYALLTLWGLFLAYVFLTKRNRLFSSYFGKDVSKDRNLDQQDVEVVNEDTALDDNSISNTDLSETVVKETDVSGTPLANKAPDNLPVSNDLPVSPVTTPPETNDHLKELNNYAHDHHVLISSDALRFLSDTCPTADGSFAVLDNVLKMCHKRYPTEDGWIVLNLERIQALIDVFDDVAESKSQSETPTTTRPLSEAILSGNLQDAYELIDRRPMVSLADAVADFDALYRQRQGNDKISVSATLKDSATKYSDGQLREVLKVFTTVLDGTYTNESHRCQGSNYKGH